MCDLCGKNSKALKSRPYRYDSGQTFTALVCSNCADLHNKLTKAGN
jgi:hypothetical protein